MGMIRFNEKGFVAECNEHCKQLFLKKITDYDKQIAPTMRANGYKRVDSSERTVLFTFGEITFSRNRWRRGNKTRYPVDEWLGLKKYMRYSSEFMYHLARYASMVSYRQVCRIVKLAYNLDISKDTVLKAVKLTGKLLSEKSHYRYFVEEEVSKKIKVPIIYVEGDGVLVKTNSGGDEKHNTDLAHFLIHTGTKQVHGRSVLLNKHEIIHANYEIAKDELLDYLYNHFDITNQTILVTNSDNGKGYTRRVFQNIQKALKITRHEHFWDAYHVKEKINQFFKPYPKALKEMMFKAVQTHNRNLLKTVLDTVESLIMDEEEYATFQGFRQKFLTNFKDTKPARLRGLSHKGIGVMESQHRQVTYRMKHRGMYWSIKGACTMAKLILLERIDQLKELFFGNWRKDYQYYKTSQLGVGYLRESKTDHSPTPQRIFKRAGKITSLDRQKLKY
ncbi:ISLre2 family transposase [Streptococcus gallolyticus subsp. gallolyticus]|uniref:ISLre2 family transposase n=1 Tax=Streptococcus gallolyticus TaxID=315405 RepID=UPI000201B71F|nr:ISLre2 family transposase [Streptococcus gallolyticus]MCY7172876.1 ISLre2 family transposase [Streptococcus gallolyticus subsp. gallolyticus]MCY7176905.1 ISLre2 family transposase [Streptococcus gallolyticus subsp. gallolyticus]MCY7179012.1 ISLre2 family transposase [Streptococcus gallolyticus subsp. gallolyticus]MCY7181604.1 ISLre2 family transposase [Streptococcus gallolyticus subsp. gallolyticus]MCY7197198.1 ISLre2 family transposase [Streptococcus gallolyticus subsp. gallolyticus]